MHQGKGGDDVAAQLSAIMEAVEFAVAEAPTVRVTVRSIEGMVSARLDSFVRAQSLPGGYAVDRRARLAWVFRTMPCHWQIRCVPLDSVALAPTSGDPSPFSQSSNGLGAGFTPPERPWHALCELIERDASTLWSIRSLRRCAATAIAPHGVAETGCAPLPRQDLRCRLPGDGVRSDDGSGRAGRHGPAVVRQAPTLFDVASGVCAHPSAIRALVGAIEEAAQTRISNITGARDDVDPAEYGLLSQAGSRPITRRDVGLRPVPASMPAIDFAGPTRPHEGSHGGGPTLARRRGTISVVRVLSGTLEDRSTNLHWRPGSRAIKAMTRL